MGLVWEESLFVFLLLTVALGCGAAWLSGRALALKWRPAWQVVAYMLLLGLALRFFHYALFAGTLLSPWYYLVDTALLLFAGLLGYRLTRVGQMVKQYRWRYRRAGPFSWRERG